MPKEGVIFYSFYGLSFRIRWTGKGIKDEIDKLFSYYHFAKQEHVNNSFNFTIHFTATEAPANIPYNVPGSLSYYDISIYEKNKHIYLTDGFSLFIVKPNLKAGSVVLHHSFKKKTPLSKHNFFLIGLIYILSSQGIFDLHAAGLVRNDTGYLLLGDPGSGKSTITLSLVRQGWKYLSDDALLLKSSGGGIEVLAFRKEFYLDTVLVNYYPEIAPYLGRAISGDSNKRFLNMDSVYPDRFCPNGFPKVLIFTHIVPQLESKLVPVDKITALIELTKQSASIFLNRWNAQTHFEVLKQLVDQTAWYQLFAGRDLYEEPEKITEVLSGVIY